MAEKNSNGKKANGKAKSNGKGGGGAAKAQAVEAGKATSPEITPEMREKLDALRGRIQVSVGQVVLALVNLPRYKSQTIGDLQHLVLEPLLRDRLAIATARPKEAGEAQSNVGENLAGIAIWASVSEEVDAKIREQVRGGVFPIRLQSDDWVSGEKLWLLDVIAPNRKLATAVLANFSQVAKDRPVSIHPIVARSVDPEVLEKMKASSTGEDGKLPSDGASPELNADSETAGEA